MFTLIDTSPCAAGMPTESRAVAYPDLAVPTLKPLFEAEIVTLPVRAADAQPAVSGMPRVAAA